MIDDQRLAWSPTTASTEFPDNAAVRAANIELPLPLARVVLCALSRLICAGTAEQRKAPYNVVQLLRVVGSLPFDRYGASEEPAHPDLVAVTAPEGGTAMKRLGVEAVDLTAYWASVQHRADDSSLPAEAALAFVPAPLWPLLGSFVLWGPEQAAARVDAALPTIARTPVKRTSRRRPDGSMLAPGTIETRISGVWKLIECLIDLRSAVHTSVTPALDSTLLESWSVKPKRPDVFAAGAVDAGIDNGGPPIEECARRLRELELDYLQAKPGSRYIRERELLLFSLLVLYGIRLMALSSLKVADYLPDRVLRDGVRGPVLRLYPGKTRRASEEYLLPLPEELAAWLGRWIEVNGFMVGQEAPLFPSTRGDQPLTPNGMYSVIAGKPNGKGSGAFALLPTGDDPYVGWRVHAYRHTAYMLAQQAGVTAKAESPVEYAHVDVVDFASAMVAHALDSSVRNTYRDMDVHKLVRAAALGGWEILRRQGRRIGPDPQAILAARIDLEALREQRHLAEAGQHHAETELDRLHSESGSIEGELLQRATLAGQRHQVAASRHGQDLARLQREIERAEQALAVARDRLVEIEEAVSDDEHAALVADALGTHSPETDGGLAAYLTVQDVADMLTTSTTTIARWIREGLPEGRTGLWTLDAWTAASPRKRRLTVGELDPTHLTEAERRRLVHVRRRRALIDAAPSREITAAGVA